MSSFPIYIKHVQIFWTHWLIFLYNWSDTYFTTKCSCHHGWTNVLFPNILKTWKIVHTYCQLSITFIILITLYNWFVIFFTFKCSFHHDWIHIMWNQKLTNWSKVSKGNAIFVYYCFFPLRCDQRCPKREVFGFWCDSCVEFPQWGLWVK